MDKSHLNSFIQQIRPTVRQAIRKTYLHVHSKHRNLDKLIKKVKDEKRKQKLDKQFASCEQEIQIFKQLKPDPITKIALTVRNLNKLVNNHELSVEERLKAKIAQNELIQKKLDEFKESFPDHEQWTDVIIELWDSKTKIKKCKDKKLVKKINEEIKQRKNLFEVGQKRNVSKKQELQEIDQHLKEQNCEERSDGGEEEKTERVIKKLKINPNLIEKSIDDLIFDGKKKETKKKSNNNKVTLKDVQESNDDQSDHHSSIQNDESDSDSDIVIDENLGDEDDYDEEDIADNQSDYEDSDQDSDGEEDQEEEEVKQAKNGETESPEDNQDYLKKQLTKVFGESAIRKREDEEVSAEEEVDDFFINKKVKKYKLTEADLRRYQELEEKQKRAERGVDQEEEEDQESIDDQPPPTQVSSKSAKKKGATKSDVHSLKRQQERQEREKQMKKDRMKFVQSNAFNTQFGVTSKKNNKKAEGDKTQEQLHPSWAAKKRLQTPIKIDFDKPAMNKKIVF